MKEILLNKMYTGEYLLEENNIGHEAINLFKADNGKNYIYILANGYINLNHTNVEAVLLTKKDGKNRVKIVAKAVGLTEIIPLDARITLEAAKKLTDKFIEENNICYGGVPLLKIFAENIDEGMPDDKSVAISFEAEKVVKAKESIYLLDKNNSAQSDVEFCLDDINFSRSSLRQYIKENTNAYKRIEEIIARQDLWGEETEILNLGGQHGANYDGDDNSPEYEVIAKFINKKKKKKQ